MCGITAREGEVTRLMLIRHAESEGNRHKTFQGWTDEEITEKGHQQALLLSKRLENTSIDIVYCSPLKRAVQTAEYVVGMRQIPVIYTDLLREIDGGDWNNKTWNEIIKNWPDKFRTWNSSPHLHSMPNGESMEAFRNRLADAVAGILCDNRGKSVAIVTHAGVIRVLMCTFYGLAFERLNEIEWQGNAEVSVIEVDREGRYHVT